MKATLQKHKPCPYVEGMKIRVYCSSFCYDNAEVGNYCEGVIEKVEHFMNNCYNLWYRTTKIVWNGKEIKQSWKVAQGSHTYSDSPFVLDITEQLELVVEQTKPWWRK